MQRRRWRRSPAAWPTSSRRSLLLPARRSRTASASWTARVCSRATPPPSPPYRSSSRWPECQQADELNGSLLYGKDIGTNPKYGTYSYHLDRIDMEWYSGVYRNNGNKTCHWHRVCSGASSWKIARDERRQNYRNAYLFVFNSFFFFAYQLEFVQ